MIIYRKKNREIFIYLINLKIKINKTDSRGKNFLHQAILGSDMETVLSLISVHVNVNSRIKDSQSKTPLHLACEVGSEMILRNLVIHLYIFCYKKESKIRDLIVDFY